MTISATVDLTQASQRRWDAIVVGAGPAGAVAARALALRDRRVLLVDRATFPRPKVCGSCLNERALAVLAAVGLGDLVHQLNASPLTGFRLAAGGRDVRLALPGGVALLRETFDAALVRAALAAGVDFLPSVSARLGAVSAETRSVELRQDGREATACGQVVLAAGGLGSLLPGAAEPVAGSRIGAGVTMADGPEYFAPGTIYMACGRAGYVGLVRVEDGRLNIAAALEPTAVRAEGLGELAAAIVAEAGMPEIAGLAAAHWRGTPPLTRQVTEPAGERLFVLGDCAGYVEPFTGEGMAWALAAAQAVAPLAAQPWTPGHAREWTASYRRLVRRRQWTCRLLAGLLRRPALTRGLVKLLAWAPQLARPVLHQLGRRS